MGHTNTANRVRLGVEALGRRDVPAVLFAFQDGDRVVAQTDNWSSDVWVSVVQGRVIVRDVESGRSWGFPAATVARVTVNGGAGHDRIDAGGLGSIPLVGYTGAGHDSVFGGAGRDTVDTGSGNDWVYGRAGDDDLRGGTGDDMLFGDAGHDRMDGGDGDDRVYGMDGHDSLTGGIGNDYLSGGVGDDRLDARDWAQGDRLHGGAGRDVFQANRRRAAFVTLSSDDLLDVRSEDRVEWA